MWVEPLSQPKKIRELNLIPNQLTVIKKLPSPKQIFKYPNDFMPVDAEIELRDSGFYCVVMFGWAQIGFRYA